MDNHNIPYLLAKLVGVADLLIDAGETTLAADALAYALEHPQSSFATRQRAQELFESLETCLCPRVLLDARTKAKETSLQQIFAAIAAL